MLLRDIRYALRSLWTSRAFTTVAVLCLAFGIGLNTTIFSIVDGVLLKPYPYKDSERILVIRGANDKRGINESSISSLDTVDLSASTKAFSELAAVQFRSLTISDTGAEAERFQGAAISWNLFPLLGVAPIRGQGFSQEMDKPGRRAGGADQPRGLARPVPLGSGGDWPPCAHQHQTGGDRRRHAGEVRVSDQPEAVDSARADYGGRNAQPARSDGVRAAGAGCQS